MGGCPFEIIRASVEGREVTDLLLEEGPGRHDTKEGRREEV